MAQNGFKKIALLTSVFLLLHCGFISVYKIPSVSASAVNVAFGCPVLTSQVAGGAPENAVDGNIGWPSWLAVSSTNGYAWIQLDLGENLAISRIEMIGRQADFDWEMRNFRFYASTQPFATVQQQADISTAHGDLLAEAGTADVYNYEWSMDFESSEKYRYLLFLKQEDGGCTEMRVFANIYKDEPIGAQYVNVASGKVPAAANAETTTASGDLANLTDNDESGDSRWVSDWVEGAPVGFFIDLGQPFQLDKLSVRCLYPGNEWHIIGIQIYGSESGDFAGSKLLGSIESVPDSMVWAEMVNTSRKFRYIKFVKPGGGQIVTSDVKVLALSADVQSVSDTANAVAITSGFDIRFNTLMDTDTLDSETISLTQGGQPVSYTPQISSDGYHTVYRIPAGGLWGGVPYAVTVRSGAESVNGFSAPQQEFIFTVAPHQVDGFVFKASADGTGEMFFGALEEGEPISATADVYNSEQGKSKDFVLVIALYDGNKMVAVAVSEGVTVAGGQNQPVFAGLKGNEVKAGCNAKAFVWNSVDYIVPYTESISTE